jgi:hypothetical protein
MPNVDRPAGFQVARHLTGGMPNRLSRYHIASGLAANIYRGDAVIPVDTSKRITVAGADDARLQGVFHGCVYVAPDGELKYSPYWPSGQTVLTGSVPDAFVYDDPNTLFMVQADGDIEPADIGAFADITRGAGNAATGLSGHELKTSAIGSGTNLKIMELAPIVGNSYGDHAKVIVLIAAHYLRGGATAI